MSACSSAWSDASCRSSSIARPQVARIVEGLEGDQFALISKTHHCMIDGVSGADLISVIMEPYPNPEPGEPVAWTPRPHPSDARLIFVAKHLERIGDYVTDICELTVYMAEATVIKHSD